MKLLFIRHAISLHNVYPELWQFDNEDMFSLTKEGVAQAYELGRRLSTEYDAYGRVVIEHSTAIRAIQTARIIQKELVKLDVTTWLHENHSIREIGTAWHPDFVYEDFANDPYYRKDNGESFHQRFVQYKERGCTGYPSKGCLRLVVSHLHAMNAIIAFELYRVGQVSEEEALKLHRMVLPHCVPLELEGVYDHTRLLGWRIGPNLMKYLPTDVQWDERHAALQSIAYQGGSVVQGSGI